MNAEVFVSLFMSVYLLRSVCHGLGIGGQHMLLIRQPLLCQTTVRCPPPPFSLFPSQLPSPSLKLFLSAAGEIAHWLHTVVEMELIQAI